MQHVTKDTLKLAPNTDRYASRHTTEHITEHVSREGATQNRCCSGARAESREQRAEGRGQRAESREQRAESRDLLLCDTLPKVLLEHHC
jgi:hypothetical protein